MDLKDFLMRNHTIPFNFTKLGKLYSIKPWKWSIHFAVYCTEHSIEWENAQIIEQLKHAIDAIINFQPERPDTCDDQCSLKINDINIAVERKER